jgi:hypothetical protein
VGVGHGDGRATIDAMYGIQTAAATFRGKLKSDELAYRALDFSADDCDAGAHSRYAGVDQVTSSSICVFTDFQN